MNISYQIASLVKVYNIPSSLVVNNSQTRIHFVLIASEKTWEIKGKKHVKIIGVDYKKQITLVIMSIISGLLLPLQIVFASNTHLLTPTTQVKKTKMQYC